MKNEAFGGLSKEDALNLNNWQHFRQVEHTEKKELIARQEAIYNHDFLDSISDDEPKQGWSILKDTTGTVVVLRSQVWPGYYAYHRCHTHIYGGCYMGDGIKNINLPFMLWWTSEVQTECMS